jgi:hypothetical protein
MVPACQHHHPTLLKKNFPLENRPELHFSNKKKKAKGEENTIQIKDDTLAHWPDHAT